MEMSDIFLTLVGRYHRLRPQQEVIKHKGKVKALTLTEGEMPHTN